MPASGMLVDDLNAHGDRAATEIAAEVLTRLVHAVGHARSRRPAAAARAIREPVPEGRGGPRRRREQPLCRGCVDRRTAARRPARRAPAARRPASREHHARAARLAGDRPGRRARRSRLRRRELVLQSARPRRSLPRPGADRLHGRDFCEDARPGCARRFSTTPSPMAACRRHGTRRTATASTEARELSVAAAIRAVRR